jgi:uncharacterized protein YcbX
VKSLLGERVDSVVVDGRGVVGDRLWSVRDPDGKLGSGKTTRRFRRMDGLLELSARYDGDVPVITFPGGQVARGDDPAVHAALTDHVGRPVTLAREEAVSHFDEGPLHLVTTASLGTVARAHGHPVDVRRTRANVVIGWEGEGFPELGWPGRRLLVGLEVVLRVTGVMPRCVMVNSAQEELPVDGSLLRDLTEVSAGALGVVADVEQGGSVAVGDEVRLTAG